MQKRSKSKGCFHKQQKQAYVHFADAIRQTSEQNELIVMWPPLTTWSGSTGLCKRKPVTRSREPSFLSGGPGPAGLQYTLHHLHHFHYLHRLLFRFLPITIPAAHRVLSDCYLSRPCHPTWRFLDLATQHFGKLTWRYQHRN